MNKLLSFSENPKKYATGSSRTKEKVDYLESIKHKLSEGQLATYNTAREKYDAALIAKQESNAQRADYGTILTDAFNSHRSVKIRYKGFWRIIDPYSVNYTYVVAYCHFARDIRTFRIDRIQGAVLLDSFRVDSSLGIAARSKIVEAPNYRGYEHKRY